MTDILVNGVQGHTVEATDRGLQYGDGLFETLAMRSGAIDNWDAHYARLARGCRQLRIPVPEEPLLRREVAQITTGTRREVVKIVVTRGSGGRGYRAPEALEPTRIVSRHDWPDYPEHWSREGIEATWCRMRMGINPGLAGIKHLNRLEQVTARSEWADEYQEGVMCDTRGNVVSGTMSNLFLVTADGLVTPALEECGIEGTQRARIMAVARDLGIPADTRSVTRDDLGSARGLFFCNSIIGLWPVRKLGQREYGIPEMTRQLMQQINGDTSQ